MRRLLLVDRDPAVVFGLRSLLRRYRGEWEVVTATSAQAALAHLGSSPFDVVVSDTGIPGDDGTELLETVQRRWPESVRVLLSADASPERALKAVPSAHQVLSKPCEAAQFEQKMVEICWLGDLIADPAMKRMVAGMSSLTARPALYDRLRTALEQPRVDLAQVGRIVESDMAMVAKILQLVNSSFFGLGRQVVNVGQAVAYLGTSALEALVLSASIGSVALPKPVPRFNAEAVQSAAEERAARARSLAPARLRDSAFTAALLADIGQLVLACAAPAELGAVLAAAEAQHRPLHQVEQDMWGFGHARAGAYLLGLWGLPVNVVHAVDRHHDPCGCELCAVLALLADQSGEMAAADVDGAA